MAELASSTRAPLFIVVPDRPADPTSLLVSLEWIEDWYSRCEELDPWAFFGYGRAIPLYLAVQDGMTPEELEELRWVETDEPYLDLVDGLFLGGSDDFKKTAPAWRALADRWGLKLHYGRATQSRIAAAKAAGADSADSSHPNRLGGDRWARFLAVIDDELGAPPPQLELFYREAA